MRKSSLRERLRYAFDNTMSRGTGALLGWLAVLSILIIVLVSAVVVATKVGPEGQGFFNIAWMSLMRTLDAGTMGGDEGSWWFLLAMFAVTIAGVFLISSLIGILTTGLENKIEKLRKGRSRVLESNHTVILGWSEQVFTIISEICQANMNQRKPCIVVMGDKDKVEMEEEIADKVTDPGRTRIVCRQGSPVEIGDLDIVNVNDARSIVVVSPEGIPDPDSNVIKTVLAITNMPDRKKEPFNIVAEIRDPKNMEIARIVGKDEVELILVGDLISRITAQTCRQPGLSLVYTELLDFGGSEIYFKEEPSLVGSSLHDALFKYDTSTVMGLFKKGAAMVNPPMDTKIEAGDKLIVISEDDDTIVLSSGPNGGVNASQMTQKKSLPPAAEKTLILGWNWRVCSIIRELDAYAAPGSQVKVVADFEGGDAVIKKECAGLVKNQAVRYASEDTTDRRVLDRLVDEGFNHVIVVCYDTLDQQQADARTLITLLHLRDISQKTGQRFSITSEMMDIKNRNLAEVAKAHDFIVSDKLISLLISQIAENRHLNAVFTDLFDPEGSEVYLKPASDYVVLDAPVSFHTVTESAARRGEIPIGYAIAALADDAEKAHGVVINPDKRAAVTYKAGDRFVVLAES